MFILIQKSLYQFNLESKSFHKVIIPVNCLKVYSQLADNRCQWPPTADEIETGVGFGAKAENEDEAEAGTGTIAAP